MRCQTVVPFVLLLAAPTLPAALAQPAWFDQATASQRIDDLRQQAGFPGLSAAIIRLDGQGTGTAVSGVRTLGEPAPIAAADRFHVGSNSKAFTAQVAARAVDAGLISWDTTLGQSFAGEFAIDPTYANVTLRELLTHNGGTPGFGSFEDWQPLQNLPGTPTQQRLGFAQQVLTQPRAVPPGADESERYSNAGFGIAAAMVERATGVAWEAAITQTFNTGMGLNVELGAPGQDGSDQPRGHAEFEGQPIIIGPDSPFFIPAAVGPAGNLSMSMTDLAQFGRQHLRALGGLTNTLDLSASSLAALHDTSFLGGPFGMGWFDINSPELGLAGYGHDGSTTAFATFLFVDPANGYAVAVGCNGFIPGTFDLDGNLALGLAVQAMRDSIIPAPGAAALFGLGGLTLGLRRRR